MYNILTLFLNNINCLKICYRYLCFVTDGCVIGVIILLHLIPIPIRTSLSNNFYFYFNRIMEIYGMGPTKHLECDLFTRHVFFNINFIFTQISINILQTYKYLNERQTIKIKITIIFSYSTQFVALTICLGILS